MKTQLWILFSTGAILASVAVVGGKELTRIDGALVQARNSADSEREAGAAVIARELKQQREERTALTQEVTRLELEIQRLEGERSIEIAELQENYLKSREQLESLLNSSSSQLTVLESSVSRIEGAEYASLIQELNANMNDQWGALEARLDTNSSELVKSLSALNKLDERLKQRRDTQKMWRELLGPVVQLAGDSSVGSGVLLQSMPVDERWRTLVVTAWHVVRDIQGTQGLDTTVPVTIYDQVGVVRIESAKLVKHDARIDVAILEIFSSRPFANGAKLPSVDSLARHAVFDRVYAVGCPLGNDPIPTAGELADTSHDIDGQNYWMINAPTFIGNSGGGIFDAESHELLGIFSKIYNYGAAQQTIIPHMGLVTPMGAIYDWIEAEGLDLDQPN
ncbi:MAG: hypothetical protein ACI9D0_001169 [Bacteroidia bacterium]|jgi:hypothetical protein